MILQPCDLLQGRQGPHTREHSFPAGIMLKGAPCGCLTTMMGNIPGLEAPRAYLPSDLFLPISSLGPYLIPLSPTQPMSAGVGKDAAEVANALVSPINIYSHRTERREAVTRSSGSVFPQGLTNGKNREGRLVPGPSCNLFHPYLGGPEIPSASNYVLPQPTLIGNPICKRCPLDEGLWIN